MLIDVAKDVWIAEGDCVDFHGFPYSTRSVIVRLPSDALWIWSPVALSDELKRSVDRLGEPAFLISPNKIHHLYLQQWRTAYPAAELWGPQSTIDKLSALRFDGALEAGPPETWSKEFELFHVTGSYAMDEFLFLHKPSQTLIVADFSEHFGDAFLKAHWRPWQRWLGRRAGIVVGKGHAPLDWRMSFLKRKTLRALKKDLLALDLQRVIMAHGEWVDSDPRRFLKTSLSWIW